MFNQSTLKLQLLDLKISDFCRVQKYQQSFTLLLGTIFKKSNTFQHLNSPPEGLTCLFGRFGLFHFLRTTYPNRWAISLLQKKPPNLILWAAVLMSYSYPGFHGFLRTETLELQKHRIRMFFFNWKRTLRLSSTTTNSTYLVPNHVP